MFRAIKIFARGYENFQLSYGRPLTKNAASSTWKFLFGLLELDRARRHLGNRKSRRRQGKRTRIHDFSKRTPAFEKVMKQISNLKKKLGQGKKTAEGGPAKQQQNGQPKKKINAKNHIDKKNPSQINVNKLNVNERPIRKKKKTKKYEGYERNGKSPEPEVIQETNLLLALGLTPVKSEFKGDARKAKLNKMRIMEEGNGKVTAEAAQLPEAPADLPKSGGAFAIKAPENCVLLDADADSTSENASATTGTLKVNGIEGKNHSSQQKDDGFSSLVVGPVPSLPCANDNNDSCEKTDAEEAVDSVKGTDKTLESNDLTVTCSHSEEKFSKASQNEKHYASSKIISISVEQCQTNLSGASGASEECADKLKKPKPVASRKRSSKSTDSEDSFKSGHKRTKFPEVDCEYRERNVREYVERASGSTLEELQMNTEKLQQEIHSLSALARAKELEWNDIIRLKKIKEEIYLRLVRRKQVMLLSMGGSGRMSGSVCWDFASDSRMTEFVTSDEVTYNRVAPSVSPKPPPRLPSNLTITKSQSSPSQNLQRFLMQPQSVSDPKPNSSVMMVPIMSSTPISISSSSPYLPPVGTSLKIPVPDRDKLKMVNSRNNPVPILPKPNQHVGQGVSNHSPPIGRQGPIVDVKSIIADYRQNHPEQVPRRGRRPKGQPSQNFAETMTSSGRGVMSMSSLALGSGAHVRTINSNAESVGGVVVPNGQELSRPSSTDSNRSTSNAPPESATSAGGVSFKDVLVQFAKMSQHQKTGDRRNSNPPNKSQGATKAPPYPEVTLHPVLPANTQSSSNSSSSLLHGILTKNNGSGNVRNESQNGSRSTTFSPTLARLLTTPDRSSMSTTITTALRGNGTVTTSSSSRVSAAPVSIADLLSTSKNRNELTITPIISNLQPAKTKEDPENNSEDDPDDSADRLVIDESEDQEGRLGDEEDVDGDSVPECQGCHIKSAQFVCAGCGNQWYCSRSCQVTAWDEHSEVCSG